MVIDMNNAVGDVIYSLRMEKGVSQEVLSGLADIGRSHLSMIERGVRRPTLETIFKIAFALDTEPSEIVSRIEDAYNSQVCTKYS